MRTFIDQLASIENKDSVVRDGLMRAREKQNRKIQDEKESRIFYRQLENPYRLTPDPLFFTKQVTKASNRPKKWNL